MSMYGELRVAVHCDKPTVTKQSFGKQCDINTIVAGYRKTGLVSHVNSKAPIFADVSKMPDYRSALDLVNAANASFMSIPSDIRKRFANDPAELIKFLADPKNVDEAVKLGLRVKPVVLPEPKPVKVEVVPAAAPKV